MREEGLAGQVPALLSARLCVTPPPRPQPAQAGAPSGAVPLLSAAYEALSQVGGGGGGSCGCLPAACRTCHGRGWAGVLSRSHWGGREEGDGTVHMALPATPYHWIYVLRAPLPLPQLDLGADEAGELGGLAAEAQAMGAQVGAAHARWVLQEGAHARQGDSGRISRRC